MERTSDDSEQYPLTVSIGELLRSAHKNIILSLLPSYRFEIAIVQIRALGGHQPGVGEDDATSQSLIERILSDGPFRLVRMPGDHVGWSSSHGGSVVMRQEWKGSLKMQGGVEKQRLKSQERSVDRAGGVPGYAWIGGR
jgi:hypothetical protein